MLLFSSMLEKASVLYMVHVVVFFNVSVLYLASHGIFFMVHVVVFFNVSVLYLASHGIFFMVHVVVFFNVRKSKCHEIFLSLSGSHCQQVDHGRCPGRNVGGAPELSPSSVMDAFAGENL